jgi:uncharacterized protein (DUF2147 family)
MKNARNNPFRPDSYFANRLLTVNRRAVASIRRSDMKTSHLLALLILAALVPAQSVGAESPTPVGVWMHASGRLEVAIAPCGDRLCGWIVWFKWPNDDEGQPLIDLKNPDPALRTRPLLGLAILYGLRPAGDGTWEGGRIYNPDDGRDYQAIMSIEADGNLRVRAYVLLPIFGETLIWTRVR